MKRMIVLAVLCAFVLSAAAASAADIKATGKWAIEAVWKDNWNFKDNGNRNNASVFEIEQRADTIFEFIANENLKGVLYTRYGAQSWGQGSFGIGQGDNNAGNTIQVRRAYVDFNWPDTTINVKAGYQAVSLPAAIGGGSMILDEEVGSAVVSGAITDNVSYLLGYARPYSTGTSSDANVDAWVAALPLSFDGFSFTPFGMYAPIGGGTTAAATANMAGLLAQNASDQGTSGRALDDAYWLGMAFQMDLFDPFVVKADLNYGKLASRRTQNEMSGWLFDASLEYKGFDFMTPEAFFVYTSGEDGNASKGNGSSERMPIVRAQNWAIGSFFFGGDTLLDGSFPGSNNGRPTYLGFWALGLSLKDIQSFAEGLTHTATLLYAQGTNDKSIGTAYTGASAATGQYNYNVAYGRTLTEDDTLIEVDFNTAYKVYDGLTLTLDLGYLNLDSKTSVWGTDNKGGDAWKVSTGILYAF
ncbi:outer membrane homotrimeric porin [Pseudodesulfovibrio sp.]|uniref:outer membrane homotrimeric porin n=1 Tax=Pseudodesulfovibrio sp. TaxID=2035812 RepID=UPI00260A65DC|nr:outer membrane homotrimeric porin [Pseudodesulfovibrio sp.]MDD3311475.1 outer membrane homotrimeric porin [Pseudodesulfovibrio sp.]